ncbi:hypothetical protein TURU_125751 [Turdus rufiventris]|nr:hypothetical protein TURU_125751 [Turdus rufiventris]
MRSQDNRNLEATQGKVQSGYRINSNGKKGKIGQVNPATLLLSEPTETMRQGSLSSVSDCKCGEMGVRFRLSGGNLPVKS